MKSPAATIPVVTNLTGATTQRLTVKADGKLFNLLADKVYTDKVKACLRETWSNALDSHVAAGNPAKFKVTLPNTLEPAFTVRDYGVGMDHETVLGLYSELMATSKGDDNSQTGFLGIGSKSPLAVSDAFTVTCFDGTTQRSYIISIDAEGGVITQLGESPSDEPRGVEVQVPVSADRIAEFREKAQIVAFGFKDDAPEGIDFVYPEPILSGTYITARPDGEDDIFGWEIVKSDLLESGDIYVRQGPVVYPVPSDAVPSGSVLSYRAHCSLVIDIPLGTADVSPDRESLSLDPITRANVRGILTTVFGEVSTAAELERIAAGNWRSQVTVAARQQLWYSRTQETDTRVYMTGGGDWELPKFLEGKKWGSLITSPVQGRRRHPLAPVEVPAGRAVVLNSADVGNHTFYVLRPNTVRAAERVKRDAKGRTPGYGSRRSSTTLHLLDNPTPRQIERMITLLGVKPHQFVPVSSIPDFPPPSKARQRSSDGTPAAPRPKRLSGVYSLDGAVELLEELPKDYLWVRSTSRAAGLSVKVFTTLGGSGVTRYTSQTSIHGAVPRHILTQLGLPTTVVGFSEKAIETHEPDPAKELHVAIDAAVTDDHVTKAKTHASIDRAVDRLYYDGPVADREVLRDALAEFLPEGYEFGDEHTSYTTIWWSAHVPSFNRYDSTSKDVVLDSIVAAVTAKYPLLARRSFTAADVASYMALVDGGAS